jgi:hypothetical protein
MYWQTNPVFTAILIGIFIVIFLLFKSRKSTSPRKGFMRFFGGRVPEYESNMDDIITLMMIQQLFNTNSSNSSDNSNHKDEDAYIDDVQDEILELLDE